MSPLCVTLYLSFVFTSLVNANPCPNSQFRLAARYRESFSLANKKYDSEKNPQLGEKYWIAFGAHGKWAIELVDAMYKNNRQIFKCKENYFGSVYAIHFDEEKEKDPDEQPRCCVAPRIIDSGKDKQTNPFAVLPFSAFKKKSYGNGAKDMYDTKSFYWGLVPNGDKKVKEKDATDGNFMKWGRFKFDDLHKEGEFVPAKDNKPVWMLHYHLEMPDIKKVEEKYPACYAANAKDSIQCATGITNDIVTFIIKCKDENKGQNYEYIKFGFSSDGTFSMKYFDCPVLFPKAKVNVQEVYYFSITALFDVKKQPPPSYNALGLGWKLGSFCASCPSTSMKIQISEKEAKMNKRRIQHAVSVGGSLNGEFMGFKAGSVNAKYTKMWFKEAAETFISGRATTISAACNGFYLWYWTVSIGTWGEGDAVIPTQLFYCSDRSTPPICKPKIAGMEDTDAYGRLCNGHDVDFDFDAKITKSKDRSKQWQSMHSGRPKPLRLQGQKQEKNEPVFKLDIAKGDAIREVIRQDDPMRPLPNQNLGGGLNDNGIRYENKQKPMPKKQDKKRKVKRSMTIDDEIKHVDKELKGIDQKLKKNDRVLKRQKSVAKMADYGEYEKYEGEYVNNEPQYYDDYEENNDRRQNGLLLDIMLTGIAFLLMTCCACVCLMCIIGYLWRRKANKNYNYNRWGSVSSQEVV